MKPWMTIVGAALAGVAGGYAASYAPGPALAQDRASGEDRWIVRTMTIQPSQDAWIVFDRDTERAAFYSFNGTNLTLLAVREIKPDLATGSYGRQSPDPEEIRRKLNERTKSEK